MPNLFGNDFTYFPRHRLHCLEVHMLVGSIIKICKRDIHNYCVLFSFSK